MKGEFREGSEEYYHYEWFDYLFGYGFGFDMMKVWGLFVFWGIIFWLLWRMG